MSRGHFVCLILVGLIMLPGWVYSDPCLEGDFTNDCQVSLADFSIVAQLWLNGASVTDLTLVSDNWLMAVNPNLLISEFMASNKVTVADGDSVYSDWIEIANVLPHSMSLKGWYLTDSLSDLYKWAFPDIQIPAGGVMAFFASNQPEHLTGDSSYYDGGHYHTNFSLDASGEDLILVKSGGQIAHAILDYPPQLYDLSYGIMISGPSSNLLIDTGHQAKYRVPQSSDAILIPSEGDPGWTGIAFNDAAWDDEIITDEPMVVISEIGTGHIDSVEIMNVSDVVIDTSGWKVLASDSSLDIDVVNSIAWDLPPTIAPSTILYKTDDPSNNYWGADLNWVPDENGWVMVIDDTGQVVDFVVWGYTQAQIAAMSIDFLSFTDITVAGNWIGEAVELASVISTPVTGPGVVLIGGSYSQNFESLGPSGTILNITGWKAGNYSDGGNAESSPHGDVDAETLIADNGSGTTKGRSYNYGTTGQSDRAVGHLPTTSSGDRALQLEITNGTGGDITEFTLTYTGEQWRDWQAGSDQKLSVWYSPSSGSNFMSMGSEFDFDAPINAGAGVALDGNAAANRELLSGLYVPTGPIAHGQSFYITWHDKNDSVSDHPLAVDDVHIEAVLTRTDYIVRSGNVDSESADDFSRSSSNGIGIVNSGLVIPFLNSTEALTAFGFADHSDYDAHIRSNMQDQMEDENASLWLRQKFNVDYLADVNTLTLQMQYDDGFIVYLNGTEVVRQNAPETLTYNASATDEHTNAQAVVFESFDITEYASLLTTESENILAIHALNLTAADSDFLIQPKLMITYGNPIPQYFGISTFEAENNPGLQVISEKVNFSHDSHCFTDNFSLTLTKDTEIGSIYYTTDGSVPNASSTKYTSPIAITATTEIRARIIATGFAPGQISGRGFVKIVSGPSDFTSNMPIIVLENFGGGSVSSTYKNFYLLGFESQLPNNRSAVLNEPDYSTRSAMHIRGNSSAGWPKKQYRLEIQNQEGFDKDISLLGLPKESDWVLNAPYADKSLIRNAFLFELANDIGLLAPRTKYCEVFLDQDGDGLEMSTTGDDYVGVYVLMENIKRGENRVDIPVMPLSVKTEPDITGGYILRFDEDGEDETDPIVYPITYTTAAPLYLRDGDLSKYQYNQTQIGWIKNYVNSTRGAIWTENAQTRIDIDSWINLLVFNELNRDQDAYFRSNYLYKDRGGKIMQGPAWDLNFSVGVGMTRDCWTNDGWQFQHNSAYMGTEWMNRVLAVEDNTQKFIDRWQECRKNQFDLNGIWTRIDRHMAAISQEAADRNYLQWSGVLTQTYWYTPPTEPYRSRTLQPWYDPSGDDQIDYIKDWIQWRLNWVDSQFVAAPKLSQNGGQIILAPLLLNLTQSAGKPIYYTTNGSDPRASGGGIAGTLYTGSISISNNTQIRARAYDSSKPATSIPDSGVLATRWSGLTDAFFSLEPQAQPGDIVITEFNYNPAPPTQAEIAAGHTDNNSFEFIELRNISGGPLNLYGINFVDGVDYTFGDVVLNNDDHLVLVKDPVAFEARYGTGLPIAGTYLGSLDNDGEELDMEDIQGVNLQVFDYKDGWFDSTDGAGFTLVARDPFNTDPNVWDNKDGWQPSSVYNGTPGVENSTAVPPLDSVIINEVLAHSDVAQPYDYIELYNMTNQPINITGWHLSDSYTVGDSGSLRYEIGVAGPVIIDPHDYAVFYEDQHFGSMSSDPGKNTGFQLSENGERVYLFYGGQSALLAELFVTEDFGASRADVSHGIYQKSTGGTNFVAMENRTPETGNGDPLVGPIVITEIMYHPTDPHDDAEYVELRNISGSSVTLYDSGTNTGWRFVDDGPDSTPDLSFDFPTTSPITLGNGQRMLLVKDRGIFDSVYDSGGTIAATGITILEWGTGSLSNGGEKPQISMPGDLEDMVRQYIRIDRISYDDSTPWPISADGGGDALHRTTDSAYGNDPDNWTAGIPSPGQ